ncbi:MAG: HTH-type transcriptional regulator IscR [Pseudomonadota bacterium]|jgi:Rrf2 family protein
MLSQRASQGILAIAHVANSPAHQSVTVASIAKHLDLSVSYTESLVKVLKQHGLLISTRGPGGGYQLKKSLVELSAWDVAKCFAMTEEASPSKRPSPEALLVDLVYEQFCQIEKDFLKDYSLASLKVETPSQGAAVAKPSLPFNFKPLPKGLMPVAPNSVFDLSKFMNLATA